jgi:hypothetical protein
VYILEMFVIEYAKCMVVDSVVGGHIKSSKKFLVKKRKLHFNQSYCSVLMCCGGVMKFVQEMFFVALTFVVHFFI